MSSSAVLGQYLWHELLTTDPEGGAGFYAKVLGWSRFPYEGDPGYAMLGNAQGPVAGVRVLGKDPLADKAGPNWLAYIGVPDITAALAAIEAKGGRVLHAVTAVPGNGGRYAVIADPHGAPIGVYEPGNMGDNSASPPAATAWHELTTENPTAALQFYHDIFGWDVLATHDMGGHVGNYYIFGKGTTQMGGVFVRSKDLPASWPRWLVYLGVPGVVAAVDKVKAAGGQVLNGPHEVPGGGWIAQVLDSHGVALALHGPKEAAAAAPKAPAKPKAKSAAKPAAAKAKPKTKVKAKTKTKTKAKAKSKKAPKAKVAPRRKAKAAVKSKAKAKTKSKSAVKAKRKSKTKVRAKARKAPRRGK